VIFCGLLRSPAVFRRAACNMSDVYIPCLRENLQHVFMYSRVYSKLWICVPANMFYFVSTQPVYRSLCVLRWACLSVCLSVCLSAKLSIFHQIFDARCLRPCFDPPKVKVSKRYTRTHMPCGITQCYLPPGRGDNPALTSAESGTRFSDPG